MILVSSIRSSWSLLILLRPFFNIAWTLLRCETFGFFHGSAPDSCTLLLCLLDATNREIITLYYFHIGMLLPHLNYEILEVGSKLLVSAYAFNRLLVNGGHFLRSLLPRTYQLRMHSQEIIIKLLLNIFSFIIFLLKKYWIFYWILNIQDG